MIIKSCSIFIPNVVQSFSATASDMVSLFPARIRPMVGSEIPVARESLAFVSIAQDFISRWIYWMRCLVTFIAHL